MRSFCFILFAASLTALAQPVTNILVEPNLIHIGQKSVSAYPEAVRKPSAPRLDRSFESQANAEEWTLQIKQQHAIDDWGIELNGQALDRLNITDSERVTHFAIPPRAILEGTNTLSIVPRGKTNDILLSQ